MHEMLNMVMKNMGFISQMAQEINNDSQAIFRKKSKMLQTQVSELFSLMKKITSAPNPELSMSLHADFIKDSFERMLNNMQELSKDYNNFGVENFDKMNKKLSQLFTNFQNSANKTTVKANN
jgi:phasin family protein